MDEYDLAPPDSLGEQRVKLIDPDRGIFRLLKTEMAAHLVFSELLDSDHPLARTYYNADHYWPCSYARDVLCYKCNGAECPFKESQ